MGLSQRIDRATLGLYTLGIFGLVMSVFGAGGRLTTIFWPGIVTYALQIERAGPSPIATALQYGSVLLFFTLSFAVHRRIMWAAALAIAFVAFDDAFLFAIGRDIGSDMFGSIELPFHALVCWWTVDAIRAMRQWRTNEDVERSVDVELELKHRLEETDAQAPRAATFETRYRPLPPGAI